MNILGINPSHNATAAILVDGKIIACVSEERFNRKKNYWGFPTESVQFCLKQAKLKPRDIDKVVVSSTIFPASPELGFTKNKLSLLPYKLMKIGQDLWHSYIEWYFPFLRLIERPAYSILVEIMKPILQNRMLRLLDGLGFKNNQIMFADHHTCHAFTGLYGAPFLEQGKEEVLVVTCDGEGDCLSATVGVYSGGKYKRIAKTDQYNSLGHFYQAITKFLGMKPLEHEYKVMGLAPYASQYEVEKLYKKIGWWIEVDKEKLQFKTLVSSYQFLRLFEKELKGYRFDVIAGVAQKICEEKMLEYVNAAIKKTGIKNVAVSGGVFMNVKMNKLIAESSRANKLFVFPSCGDESNAFGACYLGFVSKNTSVKVLPGAIKDLYLGPEFNELEIQNAIKKFRKFKFYKPKNIEKEVAKLLSNGLIVARFSGRSEFGARALGNRSLLADSANHHVVERINRMIKSRDFWMPFAPIILKEEESKFLEPIKNTFGQYMIMAYDTKEAERDNLVAALHPYDKTARPQILEKEWNPKLWLILTHFKELTGRGVLLNTSFNIHGEPVVGSPYDALSTLDRSGLEYLALGNYIVHK